MNEILLFGCGGHAHSVVDCIERSGNYHIKGFLNLDSEEYRGYKTLGNDDKMDYLFRQGIVNAHICIGYMGKGNIREKIYERIKQIGYILPVISDPSTSIAMDAVVEEGTFAAKMSVINSGAYIGKCAIINSGAIIEHDCRVGAFSHVSPGTILCGNVSVGEATHIGAGVVLRQGVNIGDHCIIGMGSVVLEDIPDNVVAYGNPCKVVGENE